MLGRVVLLRGLKKELLAAVLVGLLLCGLCAGYLLGVSNRQTETTTATTTSTGFLPTTVTQVSTGFPSSLQVYVSANFSIIEGSQALVAGVWEESTLPANTNVTVASDWSPLLGNLTVAGTHPLGLAVPCAQGWPTGIGLMQGHKAIDNLSQGKFITPWVYSCTTALVVFTYFIFSPNNSTVVAGVNKGTETVNISQIVTSNGLESGTYTVIGGDEWGHIAFAYFSVPN